MNTREQKLGLLAEMIAFAKVDGEVHDRELEFLALVAQELRIEKEVFFQMFEDAPEKMILRSEEQRIQQFYRLALLMHADGKLHEKEDATIKQLGINMGLSPYATNRVLQLMIKSPNVVIDPEDIVSAFKQQQN